jgi:hypothetical protein
MSRWSLLALATLVALPIGCSAREQSADTDVTEDTGDTADTAGSDSGDDTAFVPVEPSWIRVDGTLSIVGGVPDPTGTTVSIEYRLDPAAVPSAPEDTSDTDFSGGATVPCIRTPAVTAIVAETAPDAAITFGWWALTLDTAPDPDCGWALPSALHLGIGDLDPQLYAAMDLAGLSTPDSTLYGLYARLGAETEPVWVYGVAGTVGQYAGTDAAATSPPLPDGTYTLQALHLMPYVPGS